MGIKSVFRILLTSVFLASLSASLSGCAYGLLYTDSTSPLVTNFNKTPVGTNKAAEVSGAKMVSIPTTGLAAGWSNRAIGDAAKQAGLTEIYYADVHTFSVLLGLWQEKTVQVYGK